MQIRNTIYLFGIVVLIIGLPFSRALISISELILIVNWITTKDIFKNFKNFFRNRQAFWFSAIYLMHLIGIIYTSDMTHGFQEVKTKVPILILPLIFVTTRSVSKQQIRFFLLLFASAVTASIGTSLVLFYTQEHIHFRDAFPFISHIRLSLMVVISISILYYYLVFEPLRMRGLQVLIISVIAFNLSALVMLELLSGIVIFILLVFLTLLYHSVFKRKRIIAFIVVFVFLISSFSLALWDSYHSYFPKEPINTKQLAKQTSSGNLYNHIAENLYFENGSYIGLNLCWKELEEDWNKRSEIDFNGSDLKNQDLKYTLIRFLNSKHLTKDREGLAQLSDEDINFVENGFANIEYTKKWSVRKRMYKLFWEYTLYLQGNDVAGHSIIQRIELWKVASDIIADNWLIGIGTGDIRAEYRDRLLEKDTSLKNSNLRTHNQYLSIILAFGILGFVLFVFSLIYPAIMLRGFSNYLFLSFFMIIGVSMLWEDTMETQVGATLFAFFYAFYLFAPSTRNRSLRR